MTTTNILRLPSSIFILLGVFMFTQVCGRDPAFRDPYSPFWTAIHSVIAASQEEYIDRIVEQIHSLQIHLQDTYNDLT